MLPLTLSDTAAISQDGSSLEFIAPIASRQCYIQDASGRGLCYVHILLSEYLPIYIYIYLTLYLSTNLHKYSFYIYT